MKPVTQSQYKNPPRKSVPKNILLGVLFAGAVLISSSRPVVADDSGNADVLPGQGCMQDVAGFDLKCTANDVQLAEATNISILDDGCAYPGDDVRLSKALR